MGASQVALVVKNLPADAGDTEMQVWSLGRGDALEVEMEPHSSILARRIPWTEEPGRLRFMGLLRVRHDGASEHTYKLSTKQPMASH